MGAISAVVGGFISMIVYGLLIGGVYKLFVISSDLAEIKELLKKRDLMSPDPYLGVTHPGAPAEPHEWTVLGPEK